MKAAAIPLLLVTLSCQGAETPQIWGYGVKACRDYNQVFAGWSAGEETAILEYLRYRSWLAGLATGLSLATGMDVLKGVDVVGAMRRIQVYCDEHPDDSFFTASMDLIRGLSTLNG